MKSTLEKGVILPLNPTIYEGVNEQVEKLDTVGDSDWPDPEPLDKPLPEVKSFTGEMIPNAFRHWLEDVANRMQVPLDFCCATFVVMIGIVIGTRLAIRPKKLDDWQIPPNLWGGVAGTPSMLKSPSTDEIFKPLKRLQAKAVENFKEDKANYDVQKEVYEAKIASVKAAIKAATKKSEPTKSLEEELAVLLKEPPEEPKIQRYSTKDATPEKLADLLNENPVGLGVIRDELVGLLQSFEKSGHEQERAFYLEAWSGTGSFIVDRIQRGTTFVKSMCVSVFGGIQPDKLAGYLHKCLKGDNDGLLQRFQLLVYPDEIQDWKYVDKRPDSASKNRAYTVVEKLTKADFKQYGATIEEENAIPYLRFSEEAQTVFIDWLKDLQSKMVSEDTSPLMKEHLGKYRSLMPSLALIFHVINVADGSEPGDGVSLAATQQAVQWCKVLETHAVRIYEGLANTEDKAVLHLAKKLKSNYDTLKSGFTVRDIAMKKWAYLKKTREIQKTLDELEEADWIALQPSGNDQNKQPFGGRPKNAKYSINPKILSKTY